MAKIICTRARMEEYTDKVLINITLVKSELLRLLYVCFFNTKPNDKNLLADIIAESFGLESVSQL